MTLLRIRWRILSLLFAFSSLAYFQQKSLTVAAEQIMPTLKLSQMQIGWLQWAFLLGYTSCQLLGSVLGQRLGARSTFLIIGLLSFAATISTPLSPMVFAGTALFSALFIAQLALGIAQAPMFPAGAGVTQLWFPARSWAVANGLLTTAMHVGAALVPPLIVTLMQRFGWHRALLWTALPALALIALWAWYARDTPRQHPAVTPEELRELDDSFGGGRSDKPACESGAVTPLSLRRFARLLSEPSLLLINVSYLSMNYVFYLLSNWCFLYLVQERHFTALQSGWLATAPPLGAALGAGLGGWLTDALGGRYGVRWGYRSVPLLALPLAGALLVVAVRANTASLAVVALALCFACVELTEGSYWAATMRIAGADTMAATGVLNTCGNLGGLFGVPLVAYLSGRGAWSTAFMIGAACTAASATAWLGIDATRCLGTDRHPYPGDTRR